MRNHAAARWAKSARLQIIVNFTWELLPLKHFPLINSVRHHKHSTASDIKRPHTDKD